MSDDIEAIKQLKARYCRFLDTKDIDAWRTLFAENLVVTLFAENLVVTLDMAVSTGGADPQTAPPLHGFEQFFPVVWGGVEHAATVHHCHTPEIALTSADTATGIWAMEDMLFFPDGSELHGAGHYHETYEKKDGAWQIASLHLTRTLLKFKPA